MMVSKAARRYASALLELADEQKSVEETLEGVQLIRDTMTASKDLLLFLKSPIVKPDKKQAVLKEIFSGKVNTLLDKFMQLLTRKKRENILDEIVEAFLQVYNEYAGIIEVDVKSARSLNDQQVKDLKTVLEKMTGKKVHLQVQEQPDLKGGISVRIKDTVFDGTVKHKLDQLEELFLDTTAE